MLETTKKNNYLNYKLKQCVYVDWTTGNDKFYT